MSRWTTAARRWYMLGVMAFPVLAQVSGCLGTTSTNETRQAVSDLVAQTMNAALSYLISDAVNRALDVPSDMFGGLF